MDAVQDGKAELNGEEAKHLSRVLRVEPGQRFEVSDNRGVYLAEVETVRKEHIVFRMLESVESKPLPVRISLFAALIKFDRFEWILEKATELGVAKIVPVEAVRSERGLELAAEKRIVRWRKILLESSEQSRRAHLPEITLPVHLREALRFSGYRFVLEEESGATPLFRALPPLREQTDEVALLAGPEGGWVDEERIRFSPAGWTAVSLGPQILRAETAAIAALSVISAAWQR